MKKTGAFCRLGAGLLVFSLLFFMVGDLMRIGLSPAAADTGGAGEVVFVLDAGHGGEDGGAVGADGTLEKTLNLAMVRILGEMLQAAGQRVVYTRTDDRLLYTAEQDIRGQRKMYDLRNRLQIAEGQRGAVLVSIHMNKFTDPQYSGLQVYYGTGATESRRLAEKIQATVRADLQPANRRAVKAARENIYLLHHATVPAVLVECGFLSNPIECQKLSQQDYQRRLSFSVFCAMMEYIGENGGDT